MDEEQVQAAVVLPVARPENGSDVAQTEEVLKVCSEHSGRLIPFCAVDPEDSMALKKIEGYAEMGFRGFGEHKVKLPVDDPRSKEIYKLCGRLGLPVLLHMEDAYNPDIEGYERILAEFPDTVFIAHGPGWWKEISSEVDKASVYPRGKVKPEGRADLLLQRYPNSYADISATSGLNALQRDREFAKLFIERNWRRLLFGTDFPCVDRNGRQFGPNRSHINLLRGLNLREEVYGAITHSNAEALLKMRIGYFQSF